MRGKRQRIDTAEFSVHLTDHILSLHRDLSFRTYRHGAYHAFGVNDPKPRSIHKASVRDRLVHHAVYRKLYPYFDRFFIHDSYSCRKNRGTHRALNRFRQFARTVSRNDTATAWVLKCDIRKFFAHIDHGILMNLLRDRIDDEGTIWLLQEIIGSFQTDGNADVGLPLGNLTSQLFINIYMNAFDQCMKRTLKERHYIRYADDFVVLHENRVHLEGLLPKIAAFLGAELKLSLHHRKVSIKTFASGIDFLGWVHFPDHRVLRTTTKKRMMRRLRTACGSESLASYSGLLAHGNTHWLKESVKSAYGLSL